jgi:agmatine deiminase
VGIWSESPFREHRAEIRHSKDVNFVGCYANYYVCNGAVLCAQFGDARTDAEAKSTLAGAFPGRVIEQLNIDALGIGGGGIHCVTQQEPLARTTAPPARR